MIAASVEIIGASEVVQRLEGMAPRIHAAVKGSLDAWSTELSAYIKESKLSGDPLHRRSGDLSRSVVPYRRDSGTTIEGGAGAGAGIPYAKIHEYGGTITARNAPYLCFQTADGRWHKVKSVVMPERSYMRTSFREQSAQGIAEVREAVKAAVLA